MHVFHVPLVRLLRAETSLTLHALDERVRHEVVRTTHVIREQRKRLKRYVAASSRTPEHANNRNSSPQLLSASISQNSEVSPREDGIVNG